LAEKLKHQCSLKIQDDYSSVDCSQVFKELTVDETNYLGFAGYLPVLTSSYYTAAVSFLSRDC